MDATSGLVIGFSIAAIIAITAWFMRMLYDDDDELRSLREREDRVVERSEELVDERNEARELARAILHKKDIRWSLANSSMDWLFEEFDE